MSQNTQNTMQCTEFEALLMEGVEGTLEAGQMAGFRAHASSCQVCGPLFVDALAGYQALRTLPTLEPPVNLVHNILAATSEVEAKPRAGGPGWLAGLRQRMAPVFVPLMQPRIAGSFAMAFFSVALLANIMGFQMSSLRHVDLRPSAIRAAATRQYYQTSARVARYYDSMRFVYEVESRLREFKAALPAPEPAKPREQKKERKNGDTSKHPEQQEQNYVEQLPHGFVQASFDPSQPSIQRKKALPPSLGAAGHMRIQA